MSGILIDSRECYTGAEDGFLGPLPWETVIRSPVFQSYVHHLNSLHSELWGMFLSRVSEN